MRFQKKYSARSKEQLGFIAAVQTFFSDIITYRSLIWEMSKMELKAQYKNSFIGVAWLFFMPLINVAIWLLLNNGGILNPGNTEVPFAVYVIIGSTCWIFFFALQDSLSKSIVHGSHQFLLSEFPRMVIMCQKATTHLVTMVLPVVLCFIVLFLFGIPLTAKALFFPITLIPLFLFGFALGLLLSLLEVVAVDLAKALNRLLSALLFLTPVAFTPGRPTGMLSVLVKYNPLSYLVSVPRKMLLPGAFTLSDVYLAGVGVVLLFFIFSLRTFYAAETKIMERLSV